jgi:hypothetical protein
VRPYLCFILKTTQKISVKYGTRWFILNTVRFKAVNIKTVFFYDVVSCILTDGYCCFRGTCNLHLQDGRCECGYIHTCVHIHIHKFALVW